MYEHVDTTEDLRSGCEPRDVTVVDLVDPQRYSDNDEEERELDDDGENEDDSICAADCQGGTDPLEGLPTELLFARVSTGYKTRKMHVFTLSNLQDRIAETTSASAFIASVGTSNFWR